MVSIISGIAKTTLLFVFLMQPVFAAEFGVCDLDLTNHYGPFDYYDPKNHSHGTRVQLVEGAHLTQAMLQMRRGNTGDDIAGDLDYTLRAIPNHPQALNLASRLQRAVRLGNKPKSERLDRTVECYFRRALKVNAGVAETWYVWGLHLQRNGQFDEAHSRFQEAEEIGITDPMFSYNYGLLYFSMGDLEQAKNYADKAYGAGVGFPGLRKKLISAGAW